MPLFATLLRHFFLFIYFSYLNIKNNNQNENVEKNFFLGSRKNYSVRSISYILCICQQMFI